MQPGSGSQERSREGTGWASDLMFTQRVTSSLPSWIHSARFTECSLRACTLGWGLRAVWGAQDMSSRCQRLFGENPPAMEGPVMGATRPV